MEDDFFEGVDQLEATLAGVRAKTPVFYRDARSFTLVLPARLLELKKMLPDPRFVPAQVVPGIGAIHLTAFEYYDTDIQPYNEFAFGILLNSNHFLQIPAYNLLRQVIQNCFYTYIYRLPVTTKVALDGGVELYNYPKFLASIDFSDTDQWISCELAEGDDLICRIRGRKIPAPRSDTMKYLCHLYQYQQPQYAEFKVNARQYAISLKFDNAELELGTSHFMAQELKRVLITEHPIMYIYIPSMQAILYGPEHLSLASVAFFMEKGLGVPVDELSALLQKEKGKKSAPGKAAARKSAGKKAAGKKSAGKKSKKK